MVDVVYYYPIKNGAPSEVGRSLFLSLLNKKLPIKISLFPQYKKENDYLKRKYTNVDMISLSNLLRFDKNYIVHFSVEPIVFPNRKFLLYLVSIFNKKIFGISKLIINYHGDPRTEFKIKLNNKNYLTCLLQLPDYFLTSFILESADAIVVNSYSMQKLFHLKYNVSNLYVIPNALDDSWRNENKVLDLNEENTINLFFHGRFAPEKGIDLLIKAFSYNLRKEVKLKLYLAGSQRDKKYTTYLKNLCIELGIEENVIFLGSIPISLLKSYLNSVDAAIYPSIYEPFSLAILEAFSTVNGPVLYSNKSGIHDFVLKKGYNFYAFEPSIEGISNSIKILTEQKYDKTISSKQREFAAMYSWDKIADKYIELYEEVKDS
ncbi:Glycosyltransferase [Methanosarcina mazei C16]|uniref:Glycosyltransferase n=1 Tax=Methanosarcina mazei C16 TaxID=1434113 RepID=A0A0E3RWM9_METMZ|nr:glycosyltransferase family 4 protein [Methanosarcina mazei]AKB71756.1 Glycosyltransferase [Methanosarcina mazei C16]